jgi:hypothetical protein
LRTSITICFFVAFSRCCSIINRSMLALSDCDCVLYADSGIAARGAIGRQSSLATVLGVAQVGARQQPLLRRQEHQVPALMKRSTWLRRASGSV